MVLNVSKAIAVAKAFSVLLLTYFTTAQNGAITQLKSSLPAKPTWRGSRIILSPSKEKMDFR